MRSRTRLVTLIILAVTFALGLAACGPGAQQVVPTAAIATGAAVESLPTAPLAPGGDQAYPPPAAAPVNPYPSEGEAAMAPTPTVGPYPPPAEEFREPRFRIDRPVAAAATLLTGQAPPNVALAVMDVTYNGTLLGAGRSDENGRFSIPVSGLVGGNRIGVTVGELQQGQTLNQMAEQYYPYRGEGFMNLPNVGLFFDTVLVQP